MDFVAIDKVIVPFVSLIPSLSTKLSTDSVDKIEKYFVNRYLASMFRFHLKCMLHCMIIQQCFAARQAKPNACPAIVNFASIWRRFLRRACIKTVLIPVQKNEKWFSYAQRRKCPTDLSPSGDQFLSH